MTRTLALLLASIVLTPSLLAGDLERLLYRNPGLVVDLGVGLWAWPMPMDYDGDGDMDLVVTCPDGPYNGTYFFENPGFLENPGGDKLMPVFKPGKKIGKGYQNTRLSYVNGKPRVLVAATEFVDFLKDGFKTRKRVYPLDKIHQGKVRANQWHIVDWEGDGDEDLLVGVGDWTEYGWDDAYDKNGKWTRGPLRGYLYLIRTPGEKGPWQKPVKVKVGDAPLEVFGWPSPCFADFNGDGRKDLICGEFLDKLTFFENISDTDEPKFAQGVRLADEHGNIAMDLQMIVPSAVDWDGDGDMDLIVGQEDGRVALMENRGFGVRGAGGFARPRFFQQEAHELKYGALSTPFGVDWDEDGDDDLICGNTAGYISFIENLDGGVPPRWAAPKDLKAGGAVLRIQAGYNGSIQGPCEAKWGYTTLSVADWDHDGRKDIIVNSIWGEILWYRNAGEKGKPRLESARRLEVAWKNKPQKPAWFWWEPKGNQLVTQWRTTPVAIDFTGDGLNDLVALDHEGYLSLYPRRREGGKLLLGEPQRHFFGKDNKPLRLNARGAGKSGRRKLSVVDFDGDGHLDVLVNSANADLLKGRLANDGSAYFLINEGQLAERNISKHTTSPTVVDFDGDGKPELLIGAEDGYFYYQRKR
ncbi:MAG: VCBS repeat-containing protein [Planctomycetota bacterium]